MLVSCTDVGLQPAVGQGAAVYDDELHLTGEVCLSPDTDAVFPVKVLFLVDTSDSMSVTDRDMKRKRRRERRADSLPRQSCRSFLA